MSTVIILMALCLSLRSGLCQMCSFTYIKQPPEEILCNPYYDEEPTKFSLLCSLEALSDMGYNISINWFHNSSQQITDGVAASMEPDNAGMNTFQSTLSISEPDPTQDSGDYFCQAAVNGMALLPSDRFILTNGSMNEYTNSPACQDMDMMSINLYKSQTKCADVPVTKAPTTVFSTTLPTTTPPATTASPLTTQPITPSQTTPTPGVSELSDLNTLSITTELNTQSVSQQQMTDASPSTTDPRAIPEDLQVWIYVLVGVAAVFGMIIVILAIMCVGLCLRRSRSVDSETLKHNGGRDVSGGPYTIGQSSMVSNEMYRSTDKNFSSPSHCPEYNTLGEREYEVIGFFASKEQQQYSHLHRPSPPPLPNSLPNGTSVTMGFSPPNEQFRSINTLESERLGEIDGAPQIPARHGYPSPLTMLDTASQHHVYGELENPNSLSNSPNDSSPLQSVAPFERGDSGTQLLPGPLSNAHGGPYRKYSTDSSQSSNLNESLYSPITPLSTLHNGLEDIPETGMMFTEPNDPTAFPVHEYEIIPGASAKKTTSSHESPVRDSEEHNRIGAKQQSRASVKSCNYETDPKLDLGLENSTLSSVTDGNLTAGVSTNSLSKGLSEQQLNISTVDLPQHSNRSSLYKTSQIELRLESELLESSTLDSNVTTSFISTHTFDELDGLDLSHQEAPNTNQDTECKTKSHESESDKFVEASEIHVNGHDTIFHGNTNNHSNSGSSPYDRTYLSYSPSRGASSQNPSSTSSMYSPSQSHVYGTLGQPFLLPVNGYSPCRVGSKTTV